MAKRKLKKCPFCGGKAVALASPRDRELVFVVKCEKNCVNTWAYKTEEEAVKVWNRRANDESNI